MLESSSLWDAIDPNLQLGLERSLANLGLAGAVEEKRLAVALVDITVLGRPRVASLNGDEMMYAASLPKIAVLLAAFEKIAEGKMRLDRETELQLTRMIRESSNTAASAVMDRVGKSYIAGVLRSRRYRLYDTNHNGGLWVGKDYAGDGLWKRDPLHNLSHGATAMQVARYYYLLATGSLVTPEYSRKMKSILSGSALHHKFVAGIKDRYPHAALSRKSGTWHQWHSDSAIVEHGAYRYIAAALCESPEGERWLREMIVALDRLIVDGRHRAASVSEFPQ
jgi:beta-lactamase class A